MKRSIFSILAAFCLAALAVTGVFAVGMPTSGKSTSPTENLQIQITSPAVDHTMVISDAMAFLTAQQMPNGSFADDAFTTIKVILANAAAGRPIEAMTSISGYTPLDYLAMDVLTYTHNGDPSSDLNAGRAGMMATGIVAGNADPRNFGGMNLIQTLTDVYSPTSGAYGAGGTGNQWWAIVGLAAAQEPVPELATDYLINLQRADGGWGWGTLSDADTAAAVVQALLASGNVTPTHPIIGEAITFLSDSQMLDGGWGYEDWVTGDPVLSSDSTAAVIQALAAVGYIPATESWATQRGNPHTALLSFQQPDGSFGADASAILATAHAVPGLTETPLPIFGHEQRVNRALTWMQAQQSPDGSWGTTGQTLDVMLAFAAAGYDPAALTSQGNSPLDYLDAEVFAYTHDATGLVKIAATGKSILGLVAAGQDPYAFGASNLVQNLLGSYHPATGAYSTTFAYAPEQAWAILGLSAVDNPIPQKAVDFLLNAQQADGGWGWGWGSDADSTGIVLQALVAAGVPVTDTHIVSATAYLAQEQDAHGSWGYLDWFTSEYVLSANTTAYAMQGLLAIGQDLVAAWSVDMGASPYEALARFQRMDGPFTFNESDNLIATAQAVPAMLGIAYPLYPPRTVPTDGLNRAGLVIDYADALSSMRMIETTCVTFTEAQISGTELLARSGIPYGVSDAGYLNNIRGVENPPGGTYFWSYWQRHPVSGTWQASMTGANMSVVTDGGVDGWHWVDWNIFPSTEPRSNPSFEEICGDSTFHPFVPVYRGPDPDRIVTARPRVTRDGSVVVTLPFGSDLDGDGSVLVEWRVADSGGAWLPAPAAVRHDGYFVVTFPASSLTLMQDYEFRITFNDPDGTQGTSPMTVSLYASNTIYLPLVTLNHQP